MKFSSVLTSVILIALSPFAVATPAATSVTTSVAYNGIYDIASTSLNAVACSDGINGLMSRGYTTFGSLPKFPHIGAASAVAGWNSPNCGTCWSLTYTGAGGKQKSINIIAMDSTSNGFVISEAAMNELTGGHAVELGRANVQFRQVAAPVCGLA
jgi:hypothetical protein